MVAIDELISTAKRLDLIVKNSDDEFEAFIAVQIQENIKALVSQLNMIKDTPNFKNAAKQFFEQNKEK